MNGNIALVRPVSFVLAAFATLAVPRAAPAGSVTVPDHYLTVQGAIDSTAADTIFVKTGEYPEDLTLRRKVCLLAYQSPGDFAVYFDLPAVRSLHLYSNDGGSTVPLVWIRGFRFRGAVTFTNDATGTPKIVFEACRMDSGFTAGKPSGENTFGNFAVRGCLVFGGGFVHLYYPDIVNNAFIGGGLRAWGNGSVEVRGNYFEGPGDIGLNTCCGDGSTVASDNVITGFRVGIQPGERCLGNRVSDCAENGIEVPANPAGIHGTRVDDNIVRRCGANGILVQDGPVSCVLTGNAVDSVGAVGIRAEGVAPRIVRNNTVRATGSDGIRVGAGAVSSNVVLWAHGDGITGAADVDSNVVGRCTGAGIRSSAGKIEQNTVYLTLSSGIVLSGGSGAQVQRNISYGSLAYGLDAAGATAPVLGCNDWFSNAAGATNGVAPGATDLGVNPEFCNIPADDVRLAATSPLVAAPGCGLIGALGVGCATPVVSVGAPAPTARAFEAGPVPASGSIRFRWGGEGPPSTIEVFDVLGARRFHADLPAGSGEFVWNAADDAGVRLPAGVYFARRVAGPRAETARVVIQR